MTGLTLISGGTVYDPTHGVDGQVRDLWIDEGRFVAPPSDPKIKPVRVLDVGGMVVMPGGVDMHCHIAGPKVNVGRKLRADDKRRGKPCFGREDPAGYLRGGTLGSVPSTFTTGYRYAGLGYTTALDAAVTPLAARHAHEEFADTPCIDKGFLALAGNNHFVFDCIRRGDPAQLRAFVGWLVSSVKAHGIKAVNPGGVEVWKHRAAGNVEGLDDVVVDHDVTPRQVLTSLAQAVDELRLPHALHIHCNNLGLPGNWRTTLASMQALEGRRGHFTHAQFHSYGGGDQDETTFNARVSELADYVNTHPEITVDVGQVLFGDTTSMTGDGPLGHYLHQLNGGKWFSHDVELESGCGVSPIKYRHKNLVHAVQWAAGLEWFLLVKNPWQLALTTDHPNGGSFLAYPRIIRWLMDRESRREMLAKLPPKLQGRTLLPDLDREYSLSEIAVITRAAPAKILGLSHKGHLGAGADADLTVYSPHDDREQMFQFPRYVLKAGQVVIDDGELRPPGFGATFHANPHFDADVEPHLHRWFARHATISPRNYVVDPSEIDRLFPVAT